MTSRQTPLNQLPVAAAVAISRVLPGWTQDDSYRIRRAVGLNGGFVHTAQLGANDLPELRYQQREL